MPSLSLIQTYVRYRLGNRPDLISGDGLTMLTEWINAAQRRICHEHRFDQLEQVTSSLTTNASDYYISVPTNVYAILSIFDITNKFELSPFEGDYQDYERVTATGTRGKPTRWLRVANRIYFKDPPNGVYTLRGLFWIEPSTLSAPGDTPVLPAIWHDAIKILAVGNGWKDLGQDDRAIATESEYQTFLARVRTPKAIERSVPRRRGAFIRSWITNPRKGI